jgi:hypothetical protein
LYKSQASDHLRVRAQIRGHLPLPDAARARAEADTAG